MRRRDSLLIAAGLLALPTLLAAQGTIRGRVSDARGGPLARAMVSAEGSGLHATSDEQGVYELRGVAPGVYTLRVRLLGYVPQTARVTVPDGGGAVVQDFTLAEQPIALAPVDVTVGSRARHTAAEELAVPVDVFTAEMIQTQGTSETSGILQALSPSVNFPRQSVTDATDVVRPFTLRGLSPDHTLVLINGWRRHQTAVVNTFAYGTGAGSSGVDMNAIPSSAIDRLEVLRDGASAQYGSDAIAGVVNVVLKEGQFNPFVSATAGGYMPSKYDADGNTIDVNGGWGFGVGRGSLALFAQYLNREPTNRAWADPFEDAVTGVPDVIDSDGQVTTKNNPVPQPNHHWGDGLERDLLTMANLRLPLNDAGTTELYTFGGWGSRTGTGNGYRRCAVDCASFITGRNWATIFPQGYLPEFNPKVTDYSVAGGIRAATGGWSIDLGASFGHNDFQYRLNNTLNLSLGPCVAPAAPCAPGPDGAPATGDEPTIPNQTSFFAGSVEREDLAAGFSAVRQMDVGLPAPLSVALGAMLRRERFAIGAGELASRINGGHLPPDSAGPNGTFGDSDDNLQVRAGSQVFAGFDTSDVTNANRTNVGIYADLETNLTAQLLANVAARFENYSDFGSLVTGKAALRLQPSPRFTLRGAASTGFRAPGLGQSHFSKVVTNVIGGVVTDVGVFPVADSAARLLGAVPLKAEKALNLSAGFAFSPGEGITHRRLLPHQDHGPDSAGRDVRRFGHARHSGGERLQRDRWRTVLHQRTGHPHPGRRCGRRSQHACGVGNAELQSRDQLHAEPHHARRPAAGGAGHDADDRAGDHRFRHVHRHHGRASRLALDAHGAVHGRPVPRPGARLLLRQVLVRAAGLLRLVPRALRREDAVRRRAGLSVPRRRRVVRRAQSVRHLSRSAELAGDRRQLWRPVDGFQQQFRGVPVGSGVTLRL
jgi:iron complex outermembrane receptor protein